MVKVCTFLDDAQWLKLKNSVGLDQYFSIEINKVDTISCGPAFTLQTFNILRIPIIIERIKNFDILQISVFTRNCDKVMTYHKIEAPLIFVIACHEFFFYKPNCCDIFNSRWTGDYVIYIPGFRYAICCVC